MLHESDLEEESSGVVISIVIPVFNALPYLLEGLDRLVAQTYDHSKMEVILVDDGSTDGSGEVCDEYVSKHPMFKVIYQENSGNPSVPRNRGIEEAKGEYIFFHDADDYLGEEAVERMVAHAREWDSDVLIVKYGKTDRFKFVRSFEKTSVPSVNLYESTITRSSGPTKLFKRSLLLERDIRFQLCCGEDILFVYEAYLSAKTISIAADYDYYYAIYRDGGRRITRSANPQIHERRTVLTLVTLMADLITRLADPVASRKELNCSLFSCYYWALEWLLLDQREGIEPSLAMLREAVLRIWDQECMHEPNSLRSCLMLQALADGQGSQFLLRMQTAKLQDSTSFRFNLDNGKLLCRYIDFWGDTEVVIDASRLNLHDYEILSAYWDDEALKLEGTYAHPGNLKAPLVLYLDDIRTGLSLEFSCDTKRLSSHLDKARANLDMAEYRFTAAVDMQDLVGKLQEQRAKREQLDLSEPLDWLFFLGLEGSLVRKRIGARCALNAVSGFMEGGAVVASRESEAGEGEERASDPWLVIPYETEYKNFSLAQFPQSMNISEEGLVKSGRANPDNWVLLMALQASEKRAAEQIIEGAVTPDGIQAADGVVEPEGVQEPAGVVEVEPTEEPAEVAVIELSEEALETELPEQPELPEEALEIEEPEQPEQPEEAVEPELPEEALETEQPELPELPEEAVEPEQLVEPEEALEIEEPEEALGVVEIAEAEELEEVLEIEEPDEPDEPEEPEEPKEPVTDTTDVSAAEEPTSIDTPPLQESDQLSVSFPVDDDIQEQNDSVQEPDDNSQEQTPEAPEALKAGEASSQVPEISPGPDPEPDPEPEPEPEPEPDPEPEPEWLQMVEEQSEIIITVVVPVFNALPCLVEALSGLLAQTYDHSKMEVILIDDGSTDGSGGVCDEYAERHSMFKVIHQEASGNPSIPRNRGIGEARGEYIFFHDADDYLGGEALERMVTHAKEWDSDVLTVKYGKTNRVRSPRSFESRTAPSVDIYGSTITRDGAPMKLFRRELLKTHGLRFPLCYSETTMFVYEAYFLADIVSTAADYDYYYWVNRDDGKQSTRRSTKAQLRGREMTVDAISLLSGLVTRLANPVAARKELYCSLYVWYDQALKNLLSDQSEGIEPALATLREAVLRVWDQECAHRPLFIRAYLMLQALADGHDSEFLKRIQELSFHDGDPLQFELVQGKLLCRNIDFGGSAKVLVDVSRFGLYEYEVLSANWEGEVLKLEGSYVHPGDLPRPLVLYLDEVRASVSLEFLCITEKTGTHLDKGRENLKMTDYRFTASLDMRDLAERLPEHFSESELIDLDKPLIWVFSLGFRGSDVRGHIGDKRTADTLTGFVEGSALTAQQGSVTDATDEGEKEANPWLFIPYETEFKNFLLAQFPQSMDVSKEGFVRSKLAHPSKKRLFMALQSGKNLRARQIIEKAVTGNR
ncbi:MAG: glycosyltransferase [Coriobacteriales bacterium]|nr:glycosyltransferase [Coriobacteriales bacterium]